MSDNVKKIIAIIIAAIIAIVEIIFGIQINEIKNDQVESNKKIMIIEENAQAMEDYIIKQDK